MVPAVPVGNPNDSGAAARKKEDGPAAQTAGKPLGALGNSRQTALLFWAVALATVLGALFVITRRNLIVAVMGMVGTFFAIAVLYAMLYAHFLAVIQVLVYAGAIMVLFVFVVMILNREEERPWAVEGLFGKAVAGGALLYLLMRLTQVLWTVKDAKTVAAPGLVPGIGEGDPAPWGSLRALGSVLFTEQLFAFEAVSLVLLVAVVGAIAVARPGVTRIGGPAHGGDDE
jgi:NADH-quinone oxidoreductase subunit J